MKIYYLLPFILLIFIQCEEPEDIPTYQVSGTVQDHFKIAISNVKIYYSSSDYVITDDNGNFEISALEGTNLIIPTDTNYQFFPSEFTVTEQFDYIQFEAKRIPTPQETPIINWFNQNQLNNGLLESAENSNFVSLYDNALAALVFISYQDYNRAKQVFDFFNARIDSELLDGNGGFFQFRNREGVPFGRRWMGDNGWMLMALQNYKAFTNDNRYDRLITELENWLMSLQDTDGGLWGGYDENGNQIHKITEGNIDAFNAVAGYTAFHSQLLNFLKIDRWNANDKNLIAWTTNPPYYYALDLHPWAYCMLEDFPVATLLDADRHKTTQTATHNGVQVTGYCFDEDKDVVWTEGTGQMVVAFNHAGMTTDADFYLNELEKVFIPSANFTNAFGLPYATNMGTSYGAGQLWTGADTEPAISGGAWYLFGKSGFNPMLIGQRKNIPVTDKFWLE